AHRQGHRAGAGGHRPGLRRDPRALRRRLTRRPAGERRDTAATPRSPRADTAITRAPQRSASAGTAPEHTAAGHGLNTEPERVQGDMRGGRRGRPRTSPCPPRTGRSRRVGGTATGLSRLGASLLTLRAGRTYVPPNE